MSNIISALIVLGYAGVGIGFTALLFWHQDNYTSKPDTFYEATHPEPQETKTK